MRDLKWPWWQRFWRQPHFLAQHQLSLLLSLVALAALVALNIYLGDIKPLAEIDWVDVVGETLTALSFSLLLVVLCYLRPRNVITQWMLFGMLWLVLAYTQDALDEWFSIADQYWFTSVIESLPLGWVMLMVGISRWLVVHWKTLALLRQYQFNPETPMDVSTGLPTWPLLLAYQQRTAANTLVIVQCQQPVEEWAVLLLRNLLPRASMLASISRERYAIVCQTCPKTALAQWQGILQMHPNSVLVRYSIQDLQASSAQQALWQAEAQLCYE